MKTKIKNLSIYKQTGVSLIEILITTLVLGVGLLGVAALQVSSVSSNQEGLFTSQASAIADDYASRVRAARVSTLTWAGGDFPIFFAQYHNGNNNAIACDPNTPVSPLCRANGGSQAESCTLEQLGAFDKWEVCSAAANELPDGKLRIINHNNNNLRLSIVVDWDSSAGRKDTGNKNVVNEGCQGMTGSAERNCVILELIP